VARLASRSPLPLLACLSDWGLISMCEQFRCGRAVKFADTHRYDCGWPLAEGFQTPGRDPSEYRKRSAEAERMHPFDVPGHGDEAPLAADAIEPAQQELAESHHRFDDAKHRLRGLLAQSVKLFDLMPWPREPQCPWASEGNPAQQRRRPCASPSANTSVNRPVAMVGSPMPMNPLTNPASRSAPNATRRIDNGTPNNAAFPLRLIRNTGFAPATPLARS
jgi:hypothetical protein